MLPILDTKQGFMTESIDLKLLVFVMIESLPKGPDGCSVQLVFSTLSW